MTPAPTPTAAPPWLRKPRLARTLAAAAAAAVVAGCTPPPPCCVPVEGNDGAVVVSGAHANGPAPALSPETMTRLTAAIEAGLPVDLVLVSGTPALVDDLRLKKVEGTPAGRDVLARRNLKTITDHLDDPPAADGSDLLEALQLAVGQAHSRGLQHPLLIVVDPGLPDRGRLDLTRPGMLGADPGETARQLRSAKALPDLTGTTVLWSGLGYTSPPQQPLDGPRRASLQATWDAVLTTAGAQVAFDPAPRTGSPVQTSRTVTPALLPADPPPPAPCHDTTLVFTSQSAVSFRSNSDRFVHPARAHRALDPLALFLAADARRSAVVTGTTADDGDQAGQRTRARSRADTVKTYLVIRGARPAQIRTHGVGSRFPQYVRPDRDADGTLLPGPAALNRSVRITTHSAC